MGIYDTSVFSVDCNTFTVFVQTSDQNKDLVVTNLALTVKSVLSLSPNNEAAASFTVEIKNICRTYTLEPAMWMDTLVKFDFRNTAKQIEF